MTTASAEATLPPDDTDRGISTAESPAEDSAHPPVSLDGDGARTPSAPEPQRHWRHERHAPLPAGPLVETEDATDYTAIFGPRFRGAVLELDKIFRTPPTNSVYRRDFTYMSRLFYMFELYGRIKGFDLTALDSAEGKVRGRIEAMKELVIMRHDQLKILLNDNAKTIGDIHFVRTERTYRVPIISPLAMQICEVLEVVDAYVLDLEKASLTMLIERSIKAKYVEEVRKSFRSIFGIVRQERSAMRKLLDKLQAKSNDEEVRRSVSDELRLEAELEQQQSQSREAIPEGEELP